MNKCHNITGLDLSPCLFCVPFSYFFFLPVLVEVIAHPPLLIFGLFFNSLKCISVFVLSFFQISSSQKITQGKVTLNTQPTALSHTLIVAAFVYCCRDSGGCKGLPGIWNISGYDGEGVSLGTSAQSDGGGTSCHFGAQFWGISRREAGFDHHHFPSVCSSCTSVWQPVVNPCVCLCKWTHVLQVSESLSRCLFSYLLLEMNIWALLIASVGWLFISRKHHQRRVLSPGGDVLRGQASHHWPFQLNVKLLLFWLGCKHWNTCLHFCLQENNRGRWNTE